MTTPFIIEEAVKSAAIAICRMEFPTSFDEFVSPTRKRWQRYEDEAKQFLLAALPHIEKAIREYLADEMVAASRKDGDWYLTGAVALREYAEKLRARKE